MLCRVFLTVPRSLAPILQSCLDIPIFSMRNQYQQHSGWAITHQRTCVTCVVWNQPTICLMRTLSVKKLFVEKFCILKLLCLEKVYWWFCDFKLLNYATSQAVERLVGPHFQLIAVLQPTCLGFNELKPMRWTLQATETGCLTCSILMLLCRYLFKYFIEINRYRISQWTLPYAPLVHL